jgi:hypothetical protein
MKKVKVLRTAVEDLLDGKEFYNFQSPGVGDYFLDTLFSEIDSLSLYGGIPVGKKDVASPPVPP